MRKITLEEFEQLCEKTETIGTTIEEEKLMARFVRSEPNRYADQIPENLYEY